MAGIKDVAKAAGVSASTVSIVLNGHSEERKIPPATQARILQAVKDLHYEPNLSARSIRGRRQGRTIALFWAQDFRESMLARFLQGLHRAADPNDTLIVYPYVNGALSRERTLGTMSAFHGAIIANAGDEDLRWLAAHPPLFPVVLYNRDLPGFSCVLTEDRAVGGMAAGILAGEEGPAVLLHAPEAFRGMRVREEVPLEALREKGQEVRLFDVAENSSAGGYAAACLLFEQYPEVRTVFAPSDMIALGVMHRAYELSRKIPDDLSLLAIGNGLTEVDAYLNPALSLVRIPMEEMAEECLKELRRRLSGAEPGRTVIPPVFDPGASLRGSSGQKG